jgi:di/tricarboxylate transporter
MTFEQGMAFALLIGTIALFVWDRLRYDVVAMLALCVGLALGLVPFDSAFHGFGDPILVIIAAALVVSAAVERSGVVEWLVRPLVAVRSQSLLVCVLATIVSLLSAFMKNVGALALFIPIALRLARANAMTASQVLMPLSFASLIGGEMTLIGTSPNLIISRVRTELLGHPFTMFDFLPVGVGIAIVGVALISFGWRVLPRERQAHSDSGHQFHIEDYLTEVEIPVDSALVGNSVGDFEQLFTGGQLSVAAIVRDQGHRYVPNPNWQLSAGDLLVLEGDPVALKPLTDTGMVEPVAPGQAPSNALEVVVMPNSPLVTSTAAHSRLRPRFGIAVLAIRRAGRDYVSRLNQMTFQAGDVLVIDSGDTPLPQTLADLGLLPLAQRKLDMGGRRARLPLLVLVVTMAVVASGALPVAPAFFMAALVLVLFRSIPLREAYDAVQWPIIILIGALIPISEALRTTGASDLMADWLATAALHLPPTGAITMMLAASMLLTPFLHHAATVLLMGPVAASMAVKLGLHVDPFLMAVAVGAGSDFLTPIGHQCNTLVMGPGGYRFADYWRLGLPLSIMVVIAGTILIPWVWPLR